MADSVARALRDGALEGEHAPALLIKDSLDVQLGFHVFDYFLCRQSSNISSGKAQARGLVVVALARSPSCYFKLLKSRGIEFDVSSKWLHILDCYSDPAGWKDKLSKSSKECSSKDVPVYENVSVFTSVNSTSELSTSVINIGKGIIGPGSHRFSVAIDSVSALLQHAPIQSVCTLLYGLRSNGQVSSMLCSVHSDLHESRIVSSLEYVSSMVATLETIVKPKELQNSNTDNLVLLEQNSFRGRLNMRLKRRNGRVKIQCEEVSVEKGGVKFVQTSSVNIDATDSSYPKVQFNLQLTEKERTDRANVVLPFEHQGTGKPIEIYDGRRSLVSSQKRPLQELEIAKIAAAVVELDIRHDDQAKGEIHYIRDSDDEACDTDEDPDDDLDI